MTTRIPIQKLINWRKSQGRTQQSVAEEIGTSRQVWCDWERGRRIPDRKFMPRVVALTGNAVVADDFYPQLESGSHIGATGSDLDEAA